MMATLAKGAPSSSASPITMLPLDPFHLGASKFWGKTPRHQRAAYSKFEYSHQVFLIYIVGILQSFSKIFDFMI